jgi:alanine-glyoxylate transaminase/serine-glyoxylate transaminase/serine-pyruvate transaminase
LREALAILIEEGLENSIQKHARISEYFQSEVEKLGLEFYVENPVYRCPTVTSVKVPAGVNWMEVSKYAMQK